MKWIGQHIWDLISRFRNYIYLEKVDTSTSTTALVVDSDGKVGTNSTIGTGGVDSVTTTDGTFIDLEPNTPTTGAVNVTADLSAVNGTSDVTTRFLSKDNTWDVPSYTANTDTTYSAGNGLELVGATSTIFQLDLYSNAGIAFYGAVPYGAEIGLNLDHTAIPGTLSIANGGTNEATAQAAIDSLTTVSGATNEHVLTKDTATGNAIWKSIPASTPSLEYLNAVCTTTIITAATDGEASAVVIPFDTEQATSGTGRISLGSGASVNAITMTHDGVYKLDWNVATNTSVINNRILGGIKLEKGTCSGGSYTWADFSPTHGYIYDRGNGSVRKGSTAGSIIVEHTVGTCSPIYRLVLWREAASNASSKLITVINGTQINIIKLA